MHATDVIYAWASTRSDEFKDWLICQCKNLIQFRRLNYYRGQFAYFMVMSLIGGLWIYLAELWVGHGDDGCGFVDYWFLSTSSMAQTGTISSPPVR